MNRKEYNALLEKAEIYKLTNEKTDYKEDAVEVKTYKDGVAVVETYRIDKAGELTQEEIQTALLAKQVLHLKSIRGMLTYFVVISVVSIVACFLLMYS